MFVSVSMCTCACSAHTGQMRALRHPELELQAVVAIRLRAGNGIQFLCKRQTLT